VSVGIASIFILLSAKYYVTAESQEWLDLILIVITITLSIFVFGFFRAYLKSFRRWYEKKEKADHYNPLPEKIAAISLLVLGFVLVVGLILWVLDSNDWVHVPYLHPDKEGQQLNPFVRINGDASIGAVPYPAVSIVQYSVIKTIELSDVDTFNKDIALQFQGFRIDGVDYLDVTKVELPEPVHLVPGEEFEFTVIGAFGEGRTDNSSPLYVIRRSHASQSEIVETLTTQHTPGFQTLSWRRMELDGLVLVDHGWYDDGRLPTTLYARYFGSDDSELSILLDFSICDEIEGEIVSFIWSHTDTTVVLYVPQGGRHIGIRLMGTEIELMTCSISNKY